MAHLALVVFLAAVLALGAAFAPDGHTSVQEEAPKVRVTGPEERVQKMLDATLNGAPVVRPQAAERLTTMGEVAAALVSAHLGEGLDELARSGPELTGILARLDSEELRTTAWRAAFEDAFPWKPAAVRGLAAQPRPQELNRFLRLTESKLSAVRAEAVAAVGNLGDVSAVERLTELLGDPAGAVRRRAALGLANLGRAGALIVVWNDLQREERLFDMNTGLVARMDAQALLGRLFPAELKGYRATDPLSDEASAAALLALHAAIAGGANGDLFTDLPAVAALGDGPRQLDEGFGLELLSCRAGDLRLAWGLDDILWVGRAPAARVELAPGTVAALLERYSTAHSVLGEAFELEAGSPLTFGEPGCDRETFRRRRGKLEERALVLRDWDVSEGPRPAELGAVALELLATLPDEARPDDARLDRLRSRARAILEAIGGPLEPPSGAGE